MPTVQELREGLATRLRTISGLRAASTQPDNPNPPQAIVNLDSITYDSAYSRGLDEYQFTILVLAGRVAERTSQNRLEAYLNPSGSSSVKTAIQGDRTLGGKAQTLRVTEVTSYGSINVGDVTYLAANLTVVVYA
jgi:hypothetical protein